MARVRRTVRTFVVSIVVTAGVLGVAVEAGVSATTADSPPPQVPLLGVVSSGSGRYQAGTLTLTGVQPSAAWFTDRPTRAAGTMDVQAFLDLFFRGDDPPNAAVAIAGADGSGDVAIVELSDPVYRAEAKRLRMKATVIPDVEPNRLAAHPGLASYVGRNDGSLPKRFGANALLVDSASVAASPGSNPLPPPVQQGLPASDVEALADRVATDEPSLQQIMAKIRLSLQQNPQQPCMMQLYNRGADLSYNFYSKVSSVVMALQNDVAQNGGASLPQADVAQYNEAVSQLSTIEPSIQEMIQLYAAYTAGDTMC